MTIDGFWSYVSKKGFKKDIINISSMKGSKMAIDVFAWMYKAKYSYEKEGQDRIMRYFLKLYYLLLSNDVYPISVLDGIKPLMKNVTLNKRKKKSMKIYNKILELDKKIKSLDKICDINIIDSLRREKKSKERDYNLPPTKKEITQYKNLLDSLKLPYIVVDNHDAENLCAYLQKNGYVDYVMTNDGDAFAGGSNNIICGYKTNNDNFEIKYKHKIMKCLNFKCHDQLLNFCIGLGTDFNERQKGVRQGAVYWYKQIINSNDNGKLRVESEYIKYKDIVNELMYDFSKYEKSYKYMKLPNNKLITYMKKNINKEDIYKVTSDECAINIFGKILNI